MAIDIDSSIPEFRGMAGKSLKGREIFAVGTWNGDTFSLSDLEGIARNFSAVQKIHKAPLKLGHAEAQKFMGQNDGSPALGWVSNVYVAGEKLLADFSDVPDRVWELIEAGRYRKVSAEFYEDVTLDGKPIGYVLRAVALLGADIPAVNNLSDLHALMMEDKFEPPFKYKRFISFDPDNPSYRAKPMPDEKSATPEQLASIQRQLDSMADALKRKDEEIKKFQEREERSLEEVKITKFVAARTGIMGKADELVKAGKLTPASRDELEVKIRLQERRYSEADGLQVPADWVIKLFGEIATAKLPKGEAGKHVYRQNPIEDPAGKDDEAKDPAAELALKAKKLFVEHPDKYKDLGAAQIAVWEIYPELAKAYMEREQTADPAAVSSRDLDSMRKGA